MEEKRPMPSDDSSRAPVEEDVEEGGGFISAQEPVAHARERDAAGGAQGPTRARLGGVFDAVKGGRAFATDTHA